MEDDADGTAVLSGLSTDPNRRILDWRLRGGGVGVPAQSFYLDDRIALQQDSGDNLDAISAGMDAASESQYFYANISKFSCWSYQRAGFP